MTIVTDETNSSGGIGTTAQVEVTSGGKDSGGKHPTETYPNATFTPLAPVGSTPHHQYTTRYSTTPDNTSEGASSSSSSTSSTSTTTTTDIPNEINQRPPVKYPTSDYNSNSFGGPYNIGNKMPPTQRINSETSEVVALIIGIIAGALIAVILVILIILKFKSRNDRSFKIDDSKEYAHGPSAALLGNTASSTASQSTAHQYQLNGALRNGDRASMQQKQKKRDSKDIKEWYV